MGLVGVANAIGVIMMPPVSVCHHVSTMGAFRFPTLSSYQCQASSLMGSPTVPNTFNEDRSCFSTNSTPSLANALMAVGAV